MRFYIESLRAAHPLAGPPSVISRKIGSNRKPSLLFRPGFGKWLALEYTPSTILLLFHDETKALSCWRNDFPACSCQHKSEDSRWLWEGKMEKLSTLEKDGRRTGSLKKSHARYQGHRACLTRRLDWDNGNRTPLSLPGPQALSHKQFFHICEHIPLQCDFATLPIKSSAIFSSS